MKLKQKVGTLILILLTGQAYAIAAVAAVSVNANGWSIADSTPIDDLYAAESCRPTHVGVVCCHLDEFGKHVCVNHDFNEPFFSELTWISYPLQQNGENNEIN